jgi:hypothetical protein
MERDDLDLINGKMTQEEYMERQEARGVGAIVGLAMAAAPVATLRTAKWMLRTPTGRAVALAIMHRLSKNGDDLMKLGTRVQQAAVKEMKAAQKAAAREVKEVAAEGSKEPPKLPDTPKQPELPEPPVDPKQ